VVKYIFKEPALGLPNVKDADPQKIGETLAKITAESDGHLTPGAVVDAARSPRSLLHRFFEWDDKKAAHAFRLDQARTLIRVIRVQDDNDEEESAPAYISITDGKAGVSYRALGEVLQSADLQRRVMVQAEKDLQSWEARYRSLQDICSIVRKARERLAHKRQPLEDRIDA
jgi:hypothetical protein